MRDPRPRPRVAVIGWGSLIWDADGFQASVRCDPQGDVLWRAVGPLLPLEFSRVSRKRPGALTLVIDEDVGAVCRTLVAEATPPEGLDAAGAIAWAADKLAARERAPLDKIGRAGPDGVFAARGGCEVAAWLDAGDYVGAVWTDLEPTFEQATGTSFSVAAACAHLRGLPSEAFDAALDYILRAPRTTATPLRAALESAPDWADDAARRRAAWRSP